VLHFPRLLPFVVPRLRGLYPLAARKGRLKAELQTKPSDSLIVQSGLTERELMLIEQAKADFAAGRTYALEEARALSDSFIAGLRAKYPTAP